MKKPNFILIAMLFAALVLHSPNLRAADSLFSIFQSDPPVQNQKKPKPKPPVVQTSDDPDDITMPMSPVQVIPGSSANPASSVAAPAPMPSQLAPPVVQAAPPPLPPSRPPAQTIQPPSVVQAPAPIPVAPVISNGVPFEPPPVITATAPLPVPVKPPEASCTADSSLAKNITDCLSVAQAVIKAKLLPKPVCAPLPGFKPAPNEKNILFAVNKPVSGQSLGQALAPNMSSSVDALEQEQTQTGGCPQDCVRVNQPIVFVDTAPSATVADPECPSQFRSMPMTPAEVSKLDPNLTALNSNVGRVYTDVADQQIFGDVGQWTKGIVTAGSLLASPLGSYMATKSFAFGQCPGKCSYTTSMIISEKASKQGRKVQTSFAVRCGPPKAQDAFTGTIYLKNNWSCKDKPK